MACVETRLTWRAGRTRLQATATTSHRPYTGAAPTAAAGHVEELQQAFGFCAQLVRCAIAAAARASAHRTDGVVSSCALVVRQPDGERVTGGTTTRATCARWGCRRICGPPRSPCVRSTWRSRRCCYLPAPRSRLSGPSNSARPIPRAMQRGACGCDAGYGPLQHFCGHSRSSHCPSHCSVFIKP